MSNSELAHEYARRRWHLILKAGSVSAGGRAVAMGCMLAQVPLALEHLGAESFGLWVTLTGVVGLLSFADLGVGLGMQNKISEAYGRDDLNAARDVFLTGFSVLSLVSLVLLVGGTFAGGCFDWAALFKVHDPVTARATWPCLWVTFAVFCIGIPLSAAQKLAVGLQLGWVQAASSTLGSVLSLVSIVIAATLKLSLLLFVFVTLAPSLAVNAGLTAYLLRRLSWSFAPLRHGSYEHAREILGSGLLFLLPQLGATLLFVAPGAILSSMIGVDSIAPFNLAQRLLSVVTHLHGMFIIPLWPAYAEANSRGNGEWITTTFRRSIVYSLGITLVPCLLFGCIGRQVILFWTRNVEVLPSQSLVWLLATWTFFSAMGAPTAVLLNGLGRLKGQASYGVASATLGLAMMPWLIRLYGAAGVPLALLASHTAIALPLTYWESFRAVKKISASSLPGNSL